MECPSTQNQYTYYTLVLRLEQLTNIRLSITHRSDIVWKINLCALFKRTSCRQLTTNGLTVVVFQTTFSNARLVAIIRIANDGDSSSTLNLDGVVCLVTDMHEVWTHDRPLCHLDGFGWDSLIASSRY
ncbi:MAG TPA: hypothetical protein VFM18_15830 [Methanosarcina sp.]|nr:hypothetical protein [Methanosarcina sp.]